MYIFMVINIIHRAENQNNGYCTKHYMTFQWDTNADLNIQINVMYLNIYTVAMYIPYNVHLFVLLHLFFYIYTGEHEAKIVFVSS